MWPWTKPAQQPTAAPATPPPFRPTLLRVAVEPIKTPSGEVIRHKLLFVFDSGIIDVGQSTDAEKLVSLAQEICAEIGMEYR